MSNEALLAASSYGAVPEGCLRALPLRAAFADAQDSGHALDAFEDYKAEGAEIISRKGPFGAGSWAALGCFTGLHSLLSLSESP